MMDKEFVSEVRDNGRRGEPLPGCDCVRCFGYCLIDQDVAAREAALRAEDRASKSRAASAALGKGEAIDAGDACDHAEAVAAAACRDRGAPQETA